MNELFDNLKDNPINALIGCISIGAVALGIGMGFQRGAFDPDPAQIALEQSQKAEVLREQSITTANKRFDAGCEGLFYPDSSGNYAPLSAGKPVRSKAYVAYAAKLEAMGKTPREPSEIDYLPAGTPVCDVYGNAGILATVEGKPNAVITDIVNTPDRDRINKMMARYPGGIRHNASNSINGGK